MFVCMFVTVYVCVTTRINHLSLPTGCHHGQHGEAPSAAPAAGRVYMVCGVLSVCLFLTVYVCVTISPCLQAVIMANTERLRLRRQQRSSSLPIFLIANGAGGADRRSSDISEESGAYIYMSGSPLGQTEIPRALGLAILPFYLVSRYPILRLGFADAFGRQRASFYYIYPP